MTQDAQTGLVASAFGGRAPLYLLVFAIAAAVIYAWDWSRSPERPLALAGRAEATVTVQVRPANPVGPSSLALPDSAALRSQITSEENLARSLANADPRWSLPASMENIRSALLVDSRWTEQGRAIAIRFALSGEDSAWTTGVTNALAERYAEGCRARFRDDAQRRHAAATADLAETRKRLALAQSELDGYLQHYFQRQEDVARKVLTSSGTVAAVPPSSIQTPILPQTVDNPEWADVHAQLQAKRRVLTEVLKIRTPLHPEAQALQAEIADLERQLSSTPRQVANPSVAGPTTSESQAVASQAPVPAPAPAEQLEAAQTFAALTGALKTATEAESRLAEAERQAWQDQFRLPEVSLSLAPDVGALPREPGAHGIWLALLAALAVTCGVAMIFSRPAADPPLETPDEARELLGMPVLAVVRVPDLPNDPLPAPATPPALRLAWTVGGLGCIAAAVAMVVMAQ